MKKLKVFKSIGADSCIDGYCVKGLAFVVFKTKVYVYLSSLDEKGKVSKVSLDTLQFIRSKSKVSSVVLCRTLNKEQLYIIS